MLVAIFTYTLYLLWRRKYEKYGLEAPQRSIIKVCIASFLFSCFVVSAYVTLMYNPVTKTETITKDIVKHKGTYIQHDIEKSVEEPLIKVGNSWIYGDKEVYTKTTNYVYTDNNGRKEKFEIESYHVDYAESAKAELTYKVNYVDEMSMVEKVIFFPCVKSERTFISEISMILPKEK